MDHLYHGYVSHNQRVNVNNQMVGPVLCKNWKVLEKWIGGFNPK